jgi:hypothetical protein
MQSSSHLCVWLSNICVCLFYVHNWQLSCHAFGCWLTFNMTCHIYMVGPHERHRMG